MEERTYHRSVRERSSLAVPAHSAALAMPPSPDEVRLLYERVERLAEQSSIAEQLQRENDELRIEVRELRGEVRALRRENMALRSKERADASDMAVTNSVLTALHESELAQQTNREALIALRRHHAAQLAEKDIEIARLRTATRGGSSDVSSRVSTTPRTEEMHAYRPQTPSVLPQGPATSVHISMAPMPASPANFRSTRIVDSEGWLRGGLSS